MLDGLVDSYIEQFYIEVQEREGYHMYNEIIVDSMLDKEAALRQNPHILCPEDIIKCQELIEVIYYSFDDKIHQGQIVIHEELVEDIRKIFNVILEQKFPIRSAIPLADPRFHWDDDLAMQEDNSSGFNYRRIALTTRLSQHAYGRAIDINPRRNPYITKDFFKPRDGVYNVKAPGTLTRDGIIVATFKAMGWAWGGEWKDRKDYQHSEKPIQ